MRITQKTLYDYGELLPEICQASKDENASQCNNYSVLVICFEDEPDDYKIVPHDYQL